MKIAITAQGPDINDPVDSRFGRARFFLVIDTDHDGFSVADNTLNLNATQGAGIQAGQNVVALGVEALVTGHVGPKAYKTLEAGGVSIYTGTTGTVVEAIAQFKAGKLARQESADVDGHWI